MSTVRPATCADSGASLRTTIEEQVRLGVGVIYILQGFRTLYGRIGMVSIQLDIERAIATHRLTNALRLLRADGWGIARTMGLMAAIRVALWVMPFPVVYSVLRYRKDRWTIRSAARAVSHPSVPMPRLLRRVHIAARVLPRANCLVRALVAEQLFARAGYVTTLRFGVANASGTLLTAHAWVECEGSVVVGGGRELEMFTPLPPLV